MKWYFIDKKYIKRNANKLIINNPDNPISNHCCNFKVLEEKAIDFINKL